jgi:hypothetical protein
MKRLESKQKHGVFCKCYECNNAAEANLVAQKVQARAQYETLNNKEKADLQMLQYLVYLI